MSSKCKRNLSKDKLFELDAFKYSWTTRKPQWSIKKIISFFTLSLLRRNSRIKLKGLNTIIFAIWMKVWIFWRLWPILISLLVIQLRCFQSSHFLNLIEWNQTDSTRPYWRIRDFRGHGSKQVLTCLLKSFRSQFGQDWEEDYEILTFSFWFYSMSNPRRIRFNRRVSVSRKFEWK